MEMDWVLGIRSACERQNVPLFVKQTGEKLARRLRLRSKKGGDPEEWPPELRVRQYPLPLLGERPGVNRLVRGRPAGACQPAGAGQ
jgi:hypothetical protein